MKRRLGTFAVVIGVGLVAASPAWGQGLSGGCSGDVNGRAPTSMTKSDPLPIERGGSVGVNGTVPASVQGFPKKQIKSQTDVYVIVFGARIRVGGGPGTGPGWGSTVEVPEVISSLAPGIYRVEGQAAGGPTGWSCTGDGYIELAGGPLTLASGVGAAAAVGGGALLIGGRRRREAPEGGAQPDRGANLAADGAWAALVLLMLLLILFDILDPPWFLFIAWPTGAVATDGAQRTWVHGRAARGALGGLLLGLGITLLLHQFKLWPLDAAQGLIFPVGTAVLCGARARLGTAYLASAGAIAPVAVSETAPPEAEPEESDEAEQGDA